MSFIIVPSSCKPLTVANSVKFLEKLKGRDKFMRFVQYFSRFICYHILLKDPKNDLGVRLQAFYKAVGLHRKAFKLGTFVDEYLKFVEAFNSPKDDMKKYLNMALRAFQALFVVYDNVVWLQSIKVIAGDKDGVKMKSYYFRFVAAVCNLAIVLLNYKETDEKMQKMNLKADKPTMEKQGANVLGIVKNVCDVLTYGSNTKLITGLTLDDGKMGLLGAISAVAGGFPEYLKL